MIFIYFREGLKIKYHKKNNHNNRPESFRSCPSRTGRNKIRKNRKRNSRIFKAHGLLCNRSEYRQKGQNWTNGSPNSRRQKQIC